jgi:hypothetical protein
MSLALQSARPGVSRTGAMVEVFVVSSPVHFPLIEAKAFPHPAAEP